jgi:hypothetical protein
MIQVKQFPAPQLPATRDIAQPQLSTPTQQSHFSYLLSPLIKSVPQTLKQDKSPIKT